MFIDERYYNENNISTIDYDVTTIMKDFEVRKKKNIQEIEDEYWVHDLSDNTLFHDIESQQKKSFKLVDERDIDHAENVLIDSRERYNRNKNYGGEFAPNEHNIRKKEAELEIMKKNFETQLDIMQRNKILDYVYNEGWITAYIAMNNGDRFEEKLLYWCDKEQQKDGKVIKIDEIHRQYQDEEVNIKFVFNYLNKERTEKEKVMI